ncbi:MAG: Jag N-terminal domain-containing protein [Desulfobacteraceae bacterium]|nr:Jag N-terminal domain-containing protein [Desulfobacteraceae bacterium]
MTAYQDFEEKSVEKAVEKACTELNRNRDELKYDIISYGSSGIFGLVGAKKAVIRVLVSEAASGPDLSEPDRAPASREDNNHDDDSVSALVDEAFGPSTDTIREVVGQTEETVTEPEQQQEKALNPPATEDPKADPGVVADWVRGFLDQIIVLVSPDSELNLKVDAELIRFDIKGGDSARLIGKRGQTLDAIYYLVEKGVYKQFGPSVPIEIDVEGYLEKRRAELTTLAARLAQKAMDSGKPMVINRISAQDRRVVHLSLRDNREVRTQSVGNGDLRKLLIMPRKKNQAKKTRPRTE